MQRRYLRQQFEEGRYESRLLEQLEVCLLLGLHHTVDIPGDELDGLVVPVLNFSLPLEIECQFEDTLLLGVAELLTGKALVIVLKAHAIEFLTEFTIFELGLQPFCLFFGGGELVEGGVVKCEFGAGLGGGGIFLFDVVGRKSCGLRKLHQYDIYTIKFEFEVYSSFALR